MEKRQIILRSVYFTRMTFRSGDAANWFCVDELLKWSQRLSHRCSLLNYNISPHSLFSALLSLITEKIKDASRGGSLAILRVPTQSSVELILANSPTSSLLSFFLMNCTIWKAALDGRLCRTRRFPPPIDPGLTCVRGCRQYGGSRYGRGQKWSAILIFWSDTDRSVYSCIISCYFDYALYCRHAREWPSCLFKTITTGSHIEMEQEATCHHLSLFWGGLGPNFLLLPPLMMVMWLLTITAKVALYWTVPLTCGPGCIQSNIGSASIHNETNSDVCVHPSQTHWRRNISD